MSAEKHQYDGARGLSLRVFPGSCLFKKRPKWIVAAELMETSRLYARTVAKVQPEWIIQAAGPLVNKSYHEPHWEKRSRRVVALEKITLYGLTLQANRKVDFGPVDPVEARRLFIQAALVEGDYQTKAAFFAHNKQQIEAIREQEHRGRRLDILVDEHGLYACYDRVIPEHVYDHRSLQQWYHKAQRGKPRLLFFDREDFIQDGAKDVCEEAYPTHLDIHGNRLALDYSFTPGEDADGITLTLPSSLINQLPEQRFDWLVPGLLQEKITASIKGLKKSLRRNFIPAPDFAAACVDALDFGEGPLYACIGTQLHRMTGVEVRASDWQTANLPTHLRMNFRVLDHDGQVIAEGRDLHALRPRLSDHISKTFKHVHDWEIRREGITDWDFDQLPQTLEKRHNGSTVRGYPALLDKDLSVAIGVVDTPEESARLHRRGLHRLFMLVSAKDIKYLRKNLPGVQRMGLHVAPLMGPDSLRDDIIEASVDRVFLQADPDIRDRESFAIRLQHGQSELIPTANSICTLVGEILSRSHATRSRLTGNLPPACLAGIAEIKDQLDHLVYKGFIRRTPSDWLPHLPRYLDAINLRLDKLEHAPSKDRQRADSILALWEAWKTHRDDLAEDPETLRYRWMLEEFRVSLFAQPLKTVIPVSEKRLRREWEALRDGLD